MNNNFQPRLSWSMPCACMGCKHAMNCACSCTECHPDNGYLWTRRLLRLLKFELARREAMQPVCGACGKKHRLEATEIAVRFPVVSCLVNAVLNDLNYDVTLTERWLNACSSIGRYYRPGDFFDAIIAVSHPESTDLDPELKAIMYRNMDKLYL